MAEEKKPRIDLKARLGKGGGATPPPAGVGGIPAPMPAPTPGVPAAMPAPSSSQNPRIGGGGLPVPPGIPVGPPPAYTGPALDPSNPLAAVAHRPQSARPAQAQPQAQRIEGVTPAALTLILAVIRRGRMERKAS